MDRQDDLVMLNKDTRMLAAMLEDTWNEANRRGAYQHEAWYCVAERAKELRA